jgi:muramoyltetrapeptide carboxypeptidase LdcA involved in peptidoglycan recycling
LRYPRFITEGDTIGFPAPSFGCNIDPYLSRFDAAMEYFKERGFITNPGPNSKAGFGIGISNTPEKCAEELTQMYLDTANDAIIACGGGEMMCEILEHIDFDSIRNTSPKWIMGYSDITNIIHPMLTLCDTASIYGPCAYNFGLRKLHESIETALDILCGKKESVHSYDHHEKYFYDEEPLPEGVEPDPLEPLNATEKSLKAVYDSKIFHMPGEFSGDINFSGRLIGGCLDCLENLLGTPYEDTKGFLDRYETDGVIWCLEACDLNVFSIRRAMWKMDAAGWFRKGAVSGFLIGRPGNGQEMMGLNHFGAVMPYIEKNGVPAVLDCDLGHVAPSMPLVMGSIGHVKVTGNDVKIEMEFD